MGQQDGFGRTVVLTLCVCHGAVLAMGCTRSTPASKAKADAGTGMDAQDAASVGPEVADATFDRLAWVDRDTWWPSDTGGSNGKDASADVAQPSEDAPSDASRDSATTDGGSGRVVQFNGSTLNQPMDITAGPDGNLWFTDTAIAGIGRITRHGKKTDFSFPGNRGLARGIVSGPDGNLWVAASMQSGVSPESYQGAIAKVAPTGELLGRYEPDGDKASPSDITKGNDGALWFTDPGRNVIGRITTAGAITEFAIPTADSGPMGIAAGADGAVWFTEEQANKIGRITAAGTFTEFAIPTAKSTPKSMAAGKDGALWFTETDGNKIGRIATNGAITEYVVPTPQSGPFGITAGPDAAVWFTERDGGKVGRITSDGVIVEYGLHQRAHPYGITVGPDDNLWFTGFETAGYSAIYRLTPEGQPVTPYCLLVTSPNGFDFGDVPLGGSATRTITISNKGNASSGVLTVTLAEFTPANAPFAIDTDTCNGVALAAGATCEVTLSFQGTFESPTGFSGTLVITPAFGDVLSVVAGARCLLTCRIFGWSRYDFGSGYCDPARIPSSFEMTNSGNTSCGKITVTLDNGATSCGRFAIYADACDGLVLEPGARCAIDVRPVSSCTSATEFTGTLTLTPTFGEPWTVEMKATCPQ